MRKLLYCIMAISCLAVACEKIDMQNEDAIVIENITGNNIDEMLLKCNDAIDGKKVFEAMSENGVVIEKVFEWSESTWLDMTYVPGGDGVAGFVLKDDNCIVYQHSAITDTSTQDTFYGMKYECTYDNRSVTIFTKSKYHDYTYSAKVIYFKENTIIIDGVLGANDYMNEDYAERRYVYLCTLDRNALAAWKERAEE